MQVLTTIHRHDHRFAEHDETTLPADQSGVRSLRKHAFVRCAGLVAALDRDGGGMVSLPNTISADRVLIHHEALWRDRNGSVRAIRSESPFATHEQAALALLWKLEDELILAAHRPAEPSWTARVLRILRGGK